MTDIEIIDQGSLVGFRACSEAGTTFMHEMLDSAPWQWLGNILWVDHRMARNVIEGMDAEGIVYA